MTMIEMQFALKLEKDPLHASARKAMTIQQVHVRILTNARSELTTAMKPSPNVIT